MLNYSRFSPVMWSKLNIVIIQWIKSSILDTVDDWYTNNLAKNKVSSTRQIRTTQFYLEGSFECDLIDFGDDFNLICDVATSWKSKEGIFIFFKTNSSLRISGEFIIHTWERTNPEIRCSLDSFLISESLCPHVLEAETHPGYRTDHRMITVKTSNSSH